MPKQYINYGKKESVYSEQYKPHLLYLLANETEPDRDESGLADPCVTTDKCYCSDCKKTFDLNNRLNITINTYRDSYESPQSMHIRRIFKDRSDTALQPDDIPQEITCPHCGLNNKYVVIKKNKQKEDQPSAGWTIPPLMIGRYMFSYTDEDTGDITRIDDNILMNHIKISDAGHVTTETMEFSQTCDMIQNQTLSYQTKIDGEKREAIGAATQSADIFSYRKQKRNEWSHININRAENISQYATFVNGSIVTTFLDPTLAQTIGKPAAISVYKTNPRLHTHEQDMLQGGLSPDELKREYEKTTRIKAQLAMDSLKRELPHPIYSNLVMNGLNLMEHHPDSTEENTEIAVRRQAINLYMCVKYPAAVLYAADRAEQRAINYEFSEKRKAQEQPDYTAKKASDKARAKFFREEMKYVTEQLATCDDKVMHEIHCAGKKTTTHILKDGKIQKVDHYVSPNSGVSKKSPTLQEFEDRLSFFVFGPREGYPIPNDIAEKLKKKTIQQQPTQATNKLKKEFEKDPIAIASNIYTMRKYNITDINHVTQLQSLLDAQSPDVNPKPVRAKYKRSENSDRPTRSNVVNARVMVPLLNQNDLRFVKLYSATHDTKTMINDIFDNRPSNDEYRPFDDGGNWNTFCEVLRIYNDCVSNPKIKLIQTKRDLNEQQQYEQQNPEAVHTRKKHQLRAYLETTAGDPIQQAYHDFAFMYKDKTEETINGLAREIKEDMKMDEIKLFAKENGLDATFEKYRSELSRFENPIAAIETHELYSDRTLEIASRSTKPIFDVGNLHDIHDELSHISSKNIPKENDYIKLTKQDKSLEQTYEFDLSTLPKSQWIENEPEHEPGEMGTFKFKILPDRFSYVRTAQALSNCVNSGHYFRSAKEDRERIAVLYDEHNHPAVCIELHIKKNPINDTEYYISQCEGPHDAAVDARYGPIIFKWAAENKIDVDTDPRGEIARFGERRYIYGNGNADFHTTEFDSVKQAEVSPSEMRKRNENRQKAAIETFGLGDDGGVNLPQTPDDLKNFA